MSSRLQFMHNLDVKHHYMTGKRGLAECQYFFINSAFAGCSRCRMADESIGGIA